jgi:hypothetical protein
MHALYPEAGTDIQPRCISIYGCISDFAGRLVDQTNQVSQFDSCSVWTACRAGVALVSKCWQRVEASSPLQPSKLTLGYLRTARKKEWEFVHPSHLSSCNYSSKRVRENAPDLRWHLRDARSLIELTLDSDAVAHFLEMRLQLTGLQILRLSSLEYDLEQAGQLLEIGQLCNLKVCPFSPRLLATLVSL